MKLYLYAALLLILTGCSTAMNDIRLSQNDLDDLSPKEGVVVGSILLRGGKELLGGTEWKIAAVHISDPNLFSRKRYSIRAHRDGDEMIFVWKLPSGKYCFCNLVKTGLSTFRTKIGAEFQVEPQRKIFIGRMIVNFPKDEYIHIGTSVHINIEDVKETILTAANNKFDIKLTDVETRLMVLR